MLGEEETELHADVFRLLPRADGGPQVGDGIADVLALLEDERQELPAGRHVRTFCHDLARQFEGALQIVVLVRVDDVMHLVVESHQVLRIVRGGVALLCRGRAGDVAEANEALLLLGGGLALGGLDLRLHGGEETARLGHVAPALGAQVVLLGGIARQVVELGEGKLDVLLFLVDDARERRPAAVERGRERLEVGVAGGDRIVQYRAEELGRFLHTGMFEDGRHDVDVAHIAVLDAVLRLARLAYQKRNLERRLVREETMCELAMIPARLAMVGGDDQQRVRIRGENRPQRLAQRFVDVGDLAEILVGRILREERLGRAVGGVGVVDVNPEEALLPLVGLPPPGGRVAHRAGGALLNLEVH